MAREGAFAGDLRMKRNQPREKLLQEPAGRGHSRRGDSGREELGVFEGTSERNPGGRWEGTGDASSRVSSCRAFKVKARALDFQCNGSHWRDANGEDA